MVAKENTYASGSFIFLLLFGKLWRRPIEDFRAKRNHGSSPLAGAVPLVPGTIAIDAFYVVRVAPATHGIRPPMRRQPCLF